MTDHGYRGLEVFVETTAAGWNVCMMIPATQLTARGAGWGDGTPWTVFCGRCNYNDEKLVAPELSMTSALSATNYYLIDEYAHLLFRDR